MTVVASILLPAQVGPGFWVALGISLPLLLFALMGGGWLMASWLGLAEPSPPWLVEVVRDAAGEQGIEAPRVLVADLAMANAFAVPLVSRAVFTKRLLEVLDVEQVRGIAAHEMAHFGRHRNQLVTRASCSLLVLLVLIGTRPILAQLGFAGWLLLFGASLIFRSRIARLGRKLEVDADHQAGGIDAGSGAYASALERLHEENLVPAVIGSKRQSHPDLYDRLESLGAKPAYPRPAPPLAHRKALVALGVVALFLFGTVFLIRYGFGGSSVLDERDALWSIVASGGSGELLERVGIYRLEDEDFAVAETLFRGEVALEPYRPEGYAYLAIALAGQERLPEARASLDLAEELLAQEQGYLPEASSVVRRARAAVE